MPLDEILTEADQAAFTIEEFLRQEAGKDLLRFSTAGSVDDGKSTLIGRLLYDSRNVYEDQVRAVTGRQAGTQRAAIDFALLTDGLRAEREQGITIDVAYRYFSTQQRKFIIADTPGHEQYTRNMATGASTADLAIILIDARKGILPQSRRHAYIASLLGTRHLVAAVNKMDLIDFSEEVYAEIRSQLLELFEQVGARNVVTIPISALDGDNVVDRSTRMAWYAGPTLLEHLECVPVGSERAAQPFRMPVQRVIRPTQDYRGFAGQIVSGTVRKGDRVVTLPSGRSSRIAAITTFDGVLQEASAPLSVALTLEDEVDISRGDMIAETERPPTQASALQASVVWFSEQKLESHRPYLLKHGASTRNCRVTRVAARTNIHTLKDEAVASLTMNDIGVIDVELTQPLFFDAYAEDRASGSFILIDPQTNATLAAGMIRQPLTTNQNQQSGAALLLVGEDGAAWEAKLLAEGAKVVKTRLPDPTTVSGLLLLGLVVLVEGEVPETSFSELEASGIFPTDLRNGGSYDHR